ncbi:hypothetical protein FXV77_16165 [Sphingobacterium phlebotomi]|uniref:DUF4142 domain-containing protein n=1 Tax=Sphingobacterium phlebotomi TaxID=2605433 RepID=A0A5D4H1I3_9SPHI|nr:hypothetical protein [Sphingobacterium phlebotomi]TYR34152.1 hypothetical protein FXV77_16165 [Sphingobacterium phlebotomi]
MKLNTLFVVGVCASTLLASCNPKTATERQLNLTHTTLVDGDAYQFFQLVGAKVVYENDYAAYAAGIANSSQAKQLAAKAQEVYSSLIPGLDSLAIAKQVDFPIKRAAEFVVSEEIGTVKTVHEVVEDDTDSVEVEEEEEVAVAHVASASYSDDAYIHHVQHEVAVVKDQLQRMTRSTDKEVRAFAEANLEKIAELYTLAGGKEDAHAHH